MAFKTKLAVRKWDCPYCQAHHDRDVNAAKNILARAIN
ncbi:Putative transposase DNA-binding domain [Chlamydia trachomatis]|nr:Putative transposase DNA-binding domain [Chlamydia trachomatis]